jgi:YidC/Oxa1 family membrane protein insertase
MEQARMFIAIGLSFLVFVVWMYFFSEEKPLPPKDTEKKEMIQKGKEPVEEKAKPDEEALLTETETKEQDVQTKEKSTRVIKVDTPLFVTEITENGGAIRSFKLKQYRESVEVDSAYKEILPDDMEKGTAVVSFHKDSITGMDKGVYRLDTNDDLVSVKDKDMEIRMQWQSKDGIVIEKIYRFSPKTYLIGYDVIVKNSSNNVIKDRLAIHLNSKVKDGGMTYGFEGPCALISNELEQVDFDDIEDKDSYLEEGQIKWIGILDRYFMTSVIPKKPSDSGWRLALADNQWLSARYLQAEKAIRPGTKHTYHFNLFFGPKSYKLLSTYNNDLDKAVNFGMFDILAKPCL